MADFATASAEELQRRAAALSDAERQTLREALQLLEETGGTRGPGAGEDFWEFMGKMIYRRYESR